MKVDFFFVYRVKAHGRDRIQNGSGGNITKGTIMWTNLVLRMIYCVYKLLHETQIDVEYERCENLKLTQSEEQ